MCIISFWYIGRHILKKIYFPDIFSPFSLTILLNLIYSILSSIYAVSLLYGCNSTSTTSEDLKSLHLPTFFNVFPWVYFCLSYSLSFALSVFFKYLEIFGYWGIFCLLSFIIYLFLIIIFKKLFVPDLCHGVWAFSSCGELEPPFSSSLLRGVRVASPAAVTGSREGRPSRCSSPV